MRAMGSALSRLITVQNLQLGREKAASLHCRLCYSAILVQLMRTHLCSIFFRETNILGVGLSVSKMLSFTVLGHFSEHGSQDYVVYRWSSHPRAWNGGWR